jgi:DNA-binding Lrp family transcriptional regulator
LPLKLALIVAQANFNLTSRHYAAVCVTNEQPSTSIVYVHELLGIRNLTIVNNSIVENLKSDSISAQIINASSTKKILVGDAKMEKIRDIDRRILQELIKNSKVSDRQLGKKLGISQATITRRRKMLEREIIQDYTFIPNWSRLGYEIFAISLIKSKTSLATTQKYNAVRKKGQEWLMQQPSVLMAGGCQGPGVNAFNISVHRNYADFDDFVQRFKLEWGEAIDDIQTVLINLAGKQVLKPFNFRQLSLTEEQ